MTALTDTERSALSAAASQARQLWPLLDPGDATMHALTKQAEILRDPGNLPGPKWGPGGIDPSEEVRQLADALNGLRDAYQRAYFLAESFDALLNGGTAPPYNSDYDPNAGQARKQREDAAAMAAAQTKPVSTREFNTLPSAQQEALSAAHQPGSVIHIGRDYVRVPEPLEAALAAFEGGNTELGPIDGLGP
jgi:hypothetical protein